MRIEGKTVRLAPTDLSNYLNCAHLTQLDLAAAKGALRRPAPVSPFIEALRTKGLAHEQAYAAHLRARGLTILDLTEAYDAARTQTAMREGVDVVYQAPLADSAWFGRADFLVRVGVPSALGGYSYEAQDTKLARDTRAGTLLQLGVYSVLLGRLQGRRPDFMHVVTPGRDWRPLRYRIDDFGAYFRLLEHGIARFLTEPPATYPELVPHCDLCVWWKDCEKRRRADDHLCYVAGIGAGQIAALRELGIGTLTALATATDIAKPERGARETLLKLRDQARVQLDGRVACAPKHEIKSPIDAEHGFRLLPEPSTDDIFLDFEGNHFAEHGVEQYLTGYAKRGDDGALAYTPLWAETVAEEQDAFERFIDMAIAVRRGNTQAHIYHFGAYEPTAIKRQMGRFATREVEVDELLRGDAFVDLYAVVRRSLIASVEGYSIKNLEPHFGYERGQDLREASQSRRVIEAALELGRLDEATADDRRRVEDYNREDCESTERLQAWLERLRAEAAASGAEIPRPALAAPEASDDIKDLDRRLQDLRDRLLAGIPAEPAERTSEQQSRFLLAHLMEFHRRETKAAWWEYFRLAELAHEDYGDERRALAGLALDAVVETSGTPLLRYRFPPQEIDAREDDEVRDGDGDRIGTVAAVNLGAGSIDIKKTRAAADRHPSHVFFHKAIRDDVIRESLVRLGEHVCDKGFAVEAPYGSALRLLLGQRPPATGAARDLDGVTGDLFEPGSARSLRGPGEATVEAACRLALELDGDVLAIQGPPGTGKTFTGGEIICTLVAAGFSVGVTAVSHKVIVNLLEKAADAARSKGQTPRIAHKSKQGQGTYEGERPIVYESRNERLVEGLASGTLDVVGGTAWLWSRPELTGQVDVLIVDEAGQMALGNVLAVAPAGRSLVLLGDPQQLEQPLKSSHPEGSDVAALKHWLGEHDTMPEDAGLFLETTWRLHPAICEFTSEIYYENRMGSKPGLENQAAVGETRFAGSGLRYVPVPHTGNTARSPEEADTIVKIVDELTSGGAAWVNEAKERAPLTTEDILIVAPYNAQVGLLTEKLPALAGRIGTVDKFQGQEAPIVIYSMTSSSPLDAPRGMEFLYNPNRFNVATSRAKALCILVGSEALLAPQCRTPRQMQMANGFCRYRELAEVVEI
jgi:uncharacterized protein